MEEDGLLQRRRLRPRISLCVCQHAKRLLGEDRAGRTLIVAGRCLLRSRSPDLDPPHEQASSMTDAQENWPKPGPWCICMWAYASYLTKVMRDDALEAKSTPAATLLRALTRTHARTHEHTHTHTLLTGAVLCGRCGL